MLNPSKAIDFQKTIVVSDDKEQIFDIGVSFGEEIKRALFSSETPVTFKFGIQAGSGDGKTTLSRGIVSVFNGNLCKYLGRHPSGILLNGLRRDGPIAMRIDHYDVNMEQMRAQNKFERTFEVNPENHNLIIAEHSDLSIFNDFSGGAKIEKNGVYRRTFKFCLPPELHGWSHP